MLNGQHRVDPCPKDPYTSRFTCRFDGPNPIPTLGLVRVYPRFIPFLGHTEQILRVDRNPQLIVSNQRCWLIVIAFDVNVDAKQISEKVSSGKRVVILRVLRSCS